ncbi:MAG: hypothetical protein VX617_01010 [Pseudomonadota bacterium]|nr:hypothetical protein [Pseudomonadota bacterium]
MPGNKRRKRKPKAKNKVVRRATEELKGVVKVSGQAKQDTSSYGVMPRRSHISPTVSRHTARKR